jgi:uncharacterized protein YukE
MSGDTYITRPSVIASESATKGYEGAGIFESASGLVDGIAHGDWLGAGGNAVATGLSLIGAVMDPLQAVFAAGVGWLMEHVSFLREPLDKLMGDPHAIDGHAQSWRNIEQRIYDAVDFFVDQVNKSTAAWAAQSAEAYRRRARDHAQSVQALGKIAGGMSTATTIVGAMVGVMRNTIRDIVAEVVGACISKAIQAVTVVLIPKVVAEVAILVSKTSAKILNLLKSLFAAIKRMGALTKQMGHIIEEIGQSNRNVLRLEAFRLEALDVHGTGWKGFASGLSHAKSAYGLLSEGQIAVTGPVDQVIIETGKNASRTNGVQNAGSTGSTVTGNKPEPNPIDLPL